MNNLMAANWQKEQFSIAYVHAVTTVAGYTLFEPRVDDDSVDMLIAARGRGETPRRPRLDVQLKCTSQDLLRTDHLSFALSRKNYDDLRGTDDLVPRVLIVVAVPEEVAGWLRLSEDELALRGCGYWRTLRGMPASANMRSVTIEMPRIQTFTPDALHAMMRRISEGGAP